MAKSLKYLHWRKNLGIILIGALILAWPVLAPGNQEVKVELLIKNSQFPNLESLDSWVTIEENTLSAITEPFNSKTQPVQRVRVVITGYSSSPWETDGDPYITAAGSGVRDGIVANNTLPFGTKIKIPELFGKKIFVVEDRMSQKKSNYHIDIWFPSYWQALNFGTKKTYIEILKS